MGIFVWLMKLVWPDPCLPLLLLVCSGQQLADGQDFFVDGGGVLFSVWGFFWW
jgi:hypothetical protein